MTDHDTTWTDWSGTRCQLPLTLGSLQLLEQIGRGGMGTVYRARLNESRPYGSTGTMVAVKVLHDHLRQQVDPFKRFLREARLGLSIRHPNVVRLYDIGSAAPEGGSWQGNSWQFLVMEYVEGHTLGELQGQLSALPEGLLREITRETCAGLQAIHGHGVVHRDVKPSNLLITPTFDVKVMDLGIAFQPLAGSSITQSGSFVGSVRYASPEQFEGSAVGPCSDLYSLGVTLYQAATGKHPFEAETLSATIAAHQLTIPSRARTLRPELSSFFDEFLACLLEKDPSHRFASASETLTVLTEAEQSTWWSERRRTRTLPSTPANFGLSTSRSTNFVGRQAELDLLTHALDDVSRGQGKVLLFNGEPGVGKTRLLDEFIRFIPQDTSELFVGASAPGSSGGAPAISCAIRNRFGDTGLELALHAHLPVTPALARPVADFFLGAATQSGNLTQDSILSVLVQLCRSLSSTGPLVWILDDCHLSPEFEWSLIQTVANCALELPILLVVVDERKGANQSVESLLRLPHASSINLQRLDRDAVSEILIDTLGASDVMPQILDKLVPESGANPWIVLETIKVLGKQQPHSKKRDVSDFDILRELDSRGLPDSVRSILAARLAGLDREERKILEIAAVLGVSFDPDLIARVLSLKRLEVLQILASLEHDRGILRATEIAFAFDLPQFQEHILEELAPIMKREIHSLIADQIADREDLGGDSNSMLQGSTAATYCNHLLHANRAEEAVPYILSSMEYYASQFLWKECYTLAEKGLATFNDAHHGVRYQILQKYGFIVARQGSSGRLWQKLNAEAVEAARLSGDPGFLVDSLCNRASFQIYHNNPDDAVETLKEANRIAKREDREHDRVRILGILGAAHQERGDLERALELNADAAELALRFGKLDVLAKTQISDVTILASQGRLKDALARAKAVYTFIQDYNLDNLLAATYGYLGAMYYLNGDFPSAKETLNNVIAMYGDMSLPISAGRHVLQLGHISLIEGALSKALDHARQAASHFNLARMSPRDSRYSMVHHGPALIEARVRCLTTDPQSAVEILEPLVDTFSPDAPPHLRTDLVGTLGRMYLEAGRREEAIPLLEQAAELRELRSSHHAPLEAACLASIQERSLEEICLRDEYSPPEHADLHLLLHLAGANGDHLLQCRTLLESTARHLEGDALDQFWSNNSVARQLRQEEAKG